MDQSTPSGSHLQGPDSSHTSTAPSPSTSAPTSHKPSIRAVFDVLMDFQFFKSQWMPLPLPTNPFTGQTVIVTGSNVGLGLECARHFARLEAAKVILAVRSKSKGDEAAKSIEESTNRNGVCEVWEVDMGNFASVKAFCERAAKLERLDVVVENAGIATSTYKQMEGMESTIAVNVVGTFLMALNLLPILRNSAQKTGLTPRLVIISSGVHNWATLEEKSEPLIFEALKKNSQKYMSQRYNTSKLLEILFVRELALSMTRGAHSSQPVIINTVDPGLCHSALTRNTSGIQALVLYLLKAVFARTTEMGARTMIAAAEAGEESQGMYMSSSEVVDPSPWVRSEEGKEVQVRVYKELCDVLEGIQPGITGNI